MPPTKGLFSRRKHSTDDAFGPMQFPASAGLYGEDSAPSVGNPDAGSANQVSPNESLPSKSSRGPKSLLNPLPTSGKQKRPQIHGSSKPVPTVVTASLGSGPGGNALVFAPSAKSQGRRVVSTSSQQHQSYTNSGSGNHHHQYYNGPSHSSQLSASLFPQTTIGTTEKLKKNSILPTRSKSDSITSTFQRITGGKRKEKEKERERERERLSSEKESRYNQSSGGENYVRANGGSFEQGRSDDHSVDSRPYHSLTSRQPRHHHQFQHQSSLLQNQPSYPEYSDLRPPSAGSVDSDHGVPPTPPTKSPIKADFEVPPPPPPHSIPLPISPPALQPHNSHPRLISPLHFERDVSPSTPSTSTPSPQPHRRTRSDSLPATGLGVMPAYHHQPSRFEMGPSFDWMHNYNPPTTHSNNSRPPSSPITPTKNLEIGMPIMASENLERALRASSNDLLNQPTLQKSNNDSLVMENELLRKALLQKNEVIKSLDPSRIMEKSDGSKNEAQRVNAVLCKRVAVLEEALNSKEGAYKRAQERARELKEAHQDLIETLRTSHAKEVAQLKTQICKLENPTLVLSSNFDGLGIDFDGPGGLKEPDESVQKIDSVEKKGALSPFSLPPLPQRSGSAPLSGKVTEGTGRQMEELRKQLSEEMSRRKEAERKLEEAAARSRADMESALMENERIREQENSKHLLELRRTIEEERKLRESSKLELVDAGKMIEQLRRDRDELVEHEERMRREVTDELTELRQNYDDLMSRYEEVTEEADSLRSVVDEMNSEVDGGKREIAELKEERQKLLDKANEIMESLRKEKKRNKQLTAQLQGQLQRKGSMASSHLDIEPPLTPLSPSPVTPGFPNEDAQQLRLLVESKSREIEHLQSQNQSLHDEIDLYKLDNKNYNRDIHKRDRKLAKLQTQLSELNALLDRKSHQIISLEESLALEKRMAIPSAEGLGLPSSNSGILAGRVSAIKDENLQLRAQLRHAQDERKSAFEDASSLRRKLETFTAQQAIVLQDLENNVTRLRAEKTELEKNANKKINKLKLLLASASLNIPPKEEKLSYSALPSLGGTGMDSFFVPSYPEFTPQLERMPTLPTEPHDEEMSGPVSDSDIPGRTLSGRRRKSESRKKVHAHQYQHSEDADLVRRASKRMSLETPLPSPPPKDIQFTSQPVRSAIGGNRSTFGVGNSRQSSLKESIKDGMKPQRKASIVSALSAELVMKNEKGNLQRKASVVSEMKKDDDELVIYW